MHESLVNVPVWNGGGLTLSSSFSLYTSFLSFSIDTIRCLHPFIVSNCTKRGRKMKKIYSIQLNCCCCGAFIYNQDEDKMSQCQCDSFIAHPCHVCSLIECNLVCSSDILKYIHFSHFIVCISTPPFLSVQ